VLGFIVVLDDSLCACCSHSCTVGCVLWRSVLPLAQVLIGLGHGVMLQQSIEREFLVCDSLCPFEYHDCFCWRMQREEQLAGKTETSLSVGIDTRYPNVLRHRPS